MIRATIYLDTKPTQKKLVIFKKDTNYKDLLHLCSQKLHTKVNSLLTTSGEMIDNLLIKQSKELTVMCSMKKSDNQEKKIVLEESSVIVTSYVNKSWVVKEATDQVNALTTMKNLERIVVMPDVHSGKGHPIGVAVMTKDKIFPTLVDSDIGCGMQFIRLNVPVLTAKKCEKYASKLFLDNPCSERDFIEILTKELTWPNKLEPVDAKLFSSCHKELGTIGGGNHFAELQQVEKIVDTSLCEKYEINPETLYLLVLVDLDRLVTVSYTIF